MCSTTVCFWWRQISSLNVEVELTCREKTFHRVLWNTYNKVNYNVETAIRVRSKVMRKNKSRSHNWLNVSIGVIKVGRDHICVRLRQRGETLRPNRSSGRTSLSYTVFTATRWVIRNIEDHTEETSRTTQLITLGRSVVIVGQFGRKTS